MNDKEKPENEKSRVGDNMRGQASKDKRDGTTLDRITWGEKLALALQPVGTEKQGLWFTHKAITKRLQDHGIGIPNNLSQSIYDLLKCGYLERALKPQSMIPKYVNRPEYIYRRTAKPFKRKAFGWFVNAPSSSVEKGFQIWLDHSKLPKWFRDMMK